MGTYQTMFHAMRTGNTFVNSTKEGVEKVRQGGFAYLTDGPYLDYYNSRNPCNTMMLDNLLEAKSYGIALQRNSELTNPFSVEILKVIIKNFLICLARSMSVPNEPILCCHLLPERAKWPYLGHSALLAVP